MENRFSQLNFKVTNTRSDLEAYGNQIMNTREKCFSAKYRQLANLNVPTGYVLVTEGKRFVSMMTVCLEPFTGRFYIFDVCKNDALKGSKYAQMFERMLAAFLNRVGRPAKMSLNLRIDNPLFPMLIRKYAKSGFDTINTSLPPWLDDDPSKAIRLDADFQ